MSTTTTTEYSQLEEELTNSLDGEVSFGEDYRALYATDSSNYRQLPVGVVFPKHKEDIINTVALCRKYNLHILTRGGGTSLAGQCCNTGLIMDLSRHYNKILEIDPEKKTARIQTGLVLDDLNRALEKYDLIFGPDPSTHNHCTLGGMMGNNSCGIHSVMAQVEDGGIRTSDFVESAEILTYSGSKFEVGPANDQELEEIISKGDEKGIIYGKLRKLRDNYAEDIRNGMPQIPRRVSGYNLDDLLPENNFNVARSLVGTECTCTVFLEATVRLINRPNSRSLVLLGYDDIFEAGDHVTEIMDHKPIGLEGMDNRLVNYMHKKELHEEDLDLLPDGNGWLLVEFGAESKEKADEKAKKMMDDLKKNANGDAPSMKLYDDPDEESRVWEIRESGLGATAFVQGLPDMWPGWEDSAVPPEKVGDYLRDLRSLFQKYDYHPSVYGHFGQGCIHCRIGFDMKSKTGVETYKKFVKEAADLVVSYGGSLSGEHGDGQSRGPLLERMYGKELMKAFHEFKEIWDPDWKMNPGKVIDPRPLDADLRLGKDFRPGEHDTYFKYPKDKGSFHRATMRCVGVGECRKTNSGTMCPSYMVTRDEKQVTRGRAHLLFEMMRGKEIEGGWKSKKVKESLDLCLACKGCLSECPVSVDMATYKSEFFAHYYKNKIRPRSAYAFGIIDKWSQLASRFSGVTNFITQNKLTAPVFKKMGGIAQERAVPEYAEKPFTRASSYNEKFNNLENTVMLWPDTFNNYFFPKVLAAAANVLESAGYEVIMPENHYCCGRPLYDFGMLDKAKSYLEKILNGLSFFIQEDVPIIGLEASCIAVFRDELGNLFPNDNNAKRLQKNFKTLPEFIMENEDRFDFEDLNTSALMQKHCHHDAVMGYDPDKEILKKIGVDLNIPDSGCCGLAGSFGFEEGDKYEVSVKEGERVIWPAVRNMDEEYLISDGFSCREQIRHGTGKLPLHTAELIEKAIPKHLRKRNTMNMKRKIVVITGASAGVGRAIAKEFAKQEARILLVARGKDGLEGAKKEVEELGGEAWIYEADVADADAVNAAADYAEENIGPIDIWVNNAMVSVFSMAKDMKPEEYKRVTDVTYLGQVYGTLAAIEKMKQRNCGKIILIGSALAYRGIPLQSAYCASKHAIQGFFESVRAELLHDGINIDLSIVHLPAMNTTQFGWVKSRFDKKPRPMGNIFQPEVAARAVVEVAESGERQRMVGFSTVQTVWGNKLVPDYLDHFMAKNGISGQLTDEQEDPDRKDNLWEPVPGDHGSHGEFDNKAQNYSIYDKIYENRKTLALVGGTIIGGAFFKMLFGK